MKIEFQHIIEEHNGILYKIGRSYTQNAVDFDDLYQEMLIQLWQSYPRFKGASKISTWMYKVALNTAITFVKKHKRHQHQSTEQLPLSITPEESPFKDEEQQQKIELLYACINELKKEERAIILLHLEGNQYDEIAEIMGITVSNVGVKLLRIKKKLQKQLTAKGYARI